MGALPKSLSTFTRHLKNEIACKRVGLTHILLKRADNVVGN